MDTRNLNYWTELLWRRRNRVATVAIAVFAMVVVGTIFWPPTYRSTAQILIEDNRAQLLVSPGIQDGSPQRPTVISNPVTEEDLNSERQLLTSDYLVHQAIAGLNGPSSAGEAPHLMGAFGVLLALPEQGYRILHSAPDMTATDSWALSLLAHLSSSVIKRSNIIEVSFTSRDPQWSQKFLSLLISHYLTLHARISHDPQAERFFQQQANLEQAKLAASERQLRAFQLQTGISDLPEQRKSLIERLSALELDESKATAQLASAQGEISALSGLLRTTPQRIGKEVKSVQDLALSQIKPQVMQLRAERADLLTRYQPGSQRVAEIDAKLAAEERILNQENHLEVSERSTDLNPVWVTTDSDLSAAKTNAAALAATQAKLQTEVDKSHNQLNYLVSNESEEDRLQQQVTTDREAYLSYVRKTEEARAAGALNSNKILNVALAQPPMLPLSPLFPVVWLNFTIGFLLAVGLGVAAAEFDERRDPRIYSAATIARETGLHTVAVFSDQGLSGR